MSVCLPGLVWVWVYRWKGGISVRLVCDTASDVHSAFLIDPRYTLGGSDAVRKSSGASLGGAGGVELNGLEILEKVYVWKFAYLLCI